MKQLILIICLTISLISSNNLLGQSTTNSKFISIGIGFSKISADKIASEFDWRPSISLDGQGEFQLNRFISLIGGSGFSLLNTDNSHNNFDIRLSYLKTNFSIKYIIIQDKLSISFGGYGSYLIYKDISSNDARRSSDIDVYFNKYDFGLRNNLSYQIFNRKKNNFYIFIQYEQGFSNLIKRYSMHVSSEGMWLRNTLISTGVTFKL